MKTFDEIIAGLPGSYAGWITVADREWLALFFQEHYPNGAPTILEIGAFMGSTTNLMVLASKGRAIVVDNWSAGPHPGFTTLREGLIHHTTTSGFYPDRIEIVDGNSRVVGKTWNRAVEVVYVDGDHSYEACRDDLENFGRWASDFVLVDDYDLEPVRRATREWLAKGSWRVIRDPNISDAANPQKLFACARVR